MKPEAIARVIDQAHHRGDLLRSGAFAEIESDGVAHQVAIELHALRIGAGLRTAGWKLGYTCEAMRRQMNISQPNAAQVYSDWIAAKSTDIRRLVHPRVEPEVCITMGEVVRWSDLHALPTNEQTDFVQHRVESAACALEVVDSVWEDYRFTWAENTADGSSAAGAIIGDAIPNLQVLGELEVRLTVDSSGLNDSGLDNSVSVSGHSRDVLGNPINAVVWLVHHLDQVGETLLPGELVLTGGITSSVEFPLGSVARASFVADGWEGGVAAFR